MVAAVVHGIALSNLFCAFRFVLCSGFGRLSRLEILINRRRVHVRALWIAGVCTCARCGTQVSSKRAQEDPKERPKRPKEALRGSKQAPKSASEAPKGPLRAPQEAPRDPKRSPRALQETPRGFQESSKKLRKS